MTTKLRFGLLLCVTWLAMLAGAGFVGQSNRAWGQESGRGPRPEGESRSSYRGRFGGGDRGGERDHERGRDGRGGRSEDSHRGEERSSGSNSTTSSSSSSSNTKPAVDSKSSSSTSDDQAAKTRKWATDFVKEKDKNRNGWLDGDEIKEYKGKNAIDKDGVITVDSLVAASSSSAPAASATASTTTTSTTAGSSSNKSDGDASKRVLVGTTGGSAAGSKEKEGDKRRSYRFTTAADRLPAGLPSWFTSKDTNHDGQVSMSEYNRSWSERSVSEFRQIDLNDDGVVTAKEAAKKP